MSFVLILTKYRHCINFLLFFFFLRCCEGSLPNEKQCEEKTLFFFYYNHIIENNSSKQKFWQVYMVEFCPGNVLVINISNSLITETCKQILLLTYSYRADFTTAFSFWRIPIAPSLLFSYIVFYSIFRLIYLNPFILLKLTWMLKRVVLLIGSKLD